MYHKHFTTIDSTQKYLKDHFDELTDISENILVSCDVQTHGIGRNQNQWNAQTNSIAMSFTIAPNHKASLTPIEIGLLVCEFVKFKYNTDIYLKWPNDLLSSSHQKCAGVLSQYINEQYCIVGVGINLGKLENPVIDSSFKHGIDSAVKDLVIEKNELKDLSKSLYQYILKNRMHYFNNLSECFNQRCAHLNKKVLIDDDNQSYEGIFKGIGEFGEAIVLVDGLEKKFLSSSLKILG